MTVNVADIMTSDVVTASLPGTREDVIEVLREGEISSIPVTKDGRYRGLISREELLRDAGENQLAMLMREVPTVAPDASVQEVARIMLENDERRTPVVEGDEVVGIVTLTDIVEHIAGLEDGDDIGGYVDGRVLTLWDETPVGVAVETLTLADESAACVLDENAEMVGIVTETDCVRVADVDESSEELGEGVANQDDDWMWEGIKATSTQLMPVTRVTFPDEAVSGFMADDVVTVVRSTDVTDAAETMTENEVQHLPVKRGDELVGMVRDKDLLRAVL
ncbi:CBS domain-containing protein [Haladaptatus sp. F3-133]|jgi:CBS domain-containing protein|uniref:CBS domain-containing protein n=1 Tax=Halorutilus salinus TaxID=2487751 RepID=A0A9Q4C553_9EURY|nr:CBS domain-containing protein [Halorutilus salinus]MCX2820017.1 CBS domain-containing protein [Halorutilus salinus]